MVIVIIGPCAQSIAARQLPAALEPALERRSAFVEVDVVEVHQLLDIENSGRLDPASVATAVVLAAFISLRYRIRV